LAAENSLAESVSRAHLTLCAQELIRLSDDLSALYERKDFSQAIEQLRPFIELYPWNCGIYHALSLAHDELGDYETALEVAVPSVVLGPERRDRWHSLGRILRNLEHVEEADIANTICGYITRDGTNAGH